MIQTFWCYSILLLFTCIQEQKDWKLGETITEEAFMYMPATHQKVLWEAKMLFPK